MTYSREEVEWLGLTEKEAIAKQEALEQTKPRPLKAVFTEQLLENMPF